MLTKERMAEIEQQTVEIAQTHGLLTPRFDLVQFLTENEHFLVGEQDLGEDTAGVLLVNKNKRLPTFNTNQVIATNSRLQFEPDYQARRRFIVAHEYAHYCLHMAGEMMFAHRDFTHREDPAEQEADFFARCLLMPRDQVNTVLSAFPALDSDAAKAELIARTFGVTKKKALQRLTEDLRGVA